MAITVVERARYPLLSVCDANLTSAAWSARAAAQRVAMPSRTMSFCYANALLAGPRRAISPQEFVLSGYAVVYSETAQHAIHKVTGHRAVAETGMSGDNLDEARPSSETGTGYR